MEEERPIHLTVVVKGAVLPSWVAGILAAAFLVATLALIMVWQSTAQLAREIRILQVVTEDIENVLIRAGIATRRDFMARPDKKEGDK